MSVAEPLREQVDIREVAADELVPRHARLDMVVDAVEARLVDVPRFEIERVVADELDGFADARITEFVPLLTMRAALDRLRRRPPAAVPADDALRREVPAEA